MANFKAIIPAITVDQVIMNLINKTNADAVEITTPDCNSNPVIPSSVTPIPPGMNEIVPTIIGAKFVNVVYMKSKLRSNARKQK